MTRADATTSRTGSTGSISKRGRSLDLDRKLAEDGNGSSARGGRSSGEWRKSTTSRGCSASAELVLTESQGLAVDAAARSRRHRHVRPQALAARERARSRPGRRARRAAGAAPAAAVLDPGRVVTGVSAERARRPSPGRSTRSVPTSSSTASASSSRPRPPSDPVASIQINSLFPHQVAALCRERGKRFVHISTDCVFSGARRRLPRGRLRPTPGSLRSLEAARRGEPAGVADRADLDHRPRARLLLRPGRVVPRRSRGRQPVRGFSKAIFSGLHHRGARRRS